MATEYHAFFFSNRSLGDSIHLSLIRTASFRLWLTHNPSGLAASAPEVPELLSLASQDLLVPFTLSFYEVRTAGNISHWSRRCRSRIQNNAFQDVYRVRTHRIEIYRVDQWRYVLTASLLDRVDRLSVLTKVYVPLEFSFAPHRIQRPVTNLWFRGGCPSTRQVLSAFFFRVSFAIGLVDSLCSI